MGYNKNDVDDTGMLALDEDPHAKSSYKIVHAVKDALLFPSRNIYELKDFGTPKQWLSFFNGEPLLKDWKFKLISVIGPKDKAKKPCAR